MDNEMNQFLGESKELQSLWKEYLAEFPNTERSMLFLILYGIYNNTISEKELIKQLKVRPFRRIEIWNRKDTHDGGRIVFRKVNKSK